MTIFITINDFDLTYFFLILDFTSPLRLPGSQSSTQSFVPNEESLMMVMSMGFTKEQAIKALKATVSLYAL